MTGPENAENRPRVRRSFNPEVLQEASTITLGEEVFQGRRQVDGLTIDGSLSKDLDDAIWLQNEGDGYLLSVSIADVTSLVPRGSTLDIEAHQRTATQYFARDNDPMIPPTLSEDLLSLREGRKRPTLTVSLKLDQNLDVQETAIEPTVLESKKRFSYDEVDQAIHDKENPLSPALNEYYRVAKRLLDKRRESGALAIYDVVKGIATTEEGLVIALSPEGRHMANIIVQEFMILGNRAVATYFAEHDIPALFRNHTAKAIAADRESIMQDIENSVDYPETFNLNTLSQKVAISLNKAYYGPELAGHYGLNVPAYVHFTSPMRRYADLVNHRILHAAISGESLPYTKEELQTIGGHLTTAEQAQRNATHNFLKSQALATAARNAEDVNRLTRISPKDFSTVIKVAARDGKMSEDIAEATVNRLKSGKLAVNDIYMILLEPKGQEDIWGGIQQEVFSWLSENPAHAVSIAIMAKQSLGWPDIRYETTYVGPDHARVFTTVAMIKIGDEEIESQSIRGTNQKISQQLATVDLLGKAVGHQIELPDVEQGAVVDRPVLTPTETSMKNSLQEFCQIRRLTLPTYQVEQEGPSHMPTFRARVEITMGGRRIMSDMVTGANRREAEQAAAASLLAKLDVRPATQEPRQTRPVEIVNDNYIGALQTLSQRNRWTVPSYQVSQLGKSPEEGFTCDIRVQTTSGMITKRAVGRTSKEARQRAAELMFGELSSI